MDWILFAEIEQLLREGGSQQPREDAILWAVMFCDGEELEPGDYHFGGFHKWSERSKALELKIREWLVPDPLDPLGQEMKLMFELTPAGKKLIPAELQF